MSADVQTFFLQKFDDIQKFSYNFTIRGGAIMPKITSSAELRNNYNEISSFCHEYDEPVFITKNGKGDLAVMSIEAYEQLTARFELYGALKQGLDDIEAGRTMSAEEFLAELEAKHPELAGEYLLLKRITYRKKSKSLVSKK